MKMINLSPNEYDDTVPSLTPPLPPPPHQPIRLPPLSPGVHPRTLPNNADGTIDLTLLRAKIRTEDIHFPVTKLICLENTHNYCGGKILPLEYLDQVSPGPGQVRSAQVSAGQVRLV